MPVDEVSNMAPLWITVYGALVVISMFHCPSTQGETLYMSDFCGRTIDMDRKQMDEVVLGLTQSSKYWTNVDCEVDIVTSPNHSLFFQIMEINLYDCEDKIFFREDSSNTSDGIYKHMCNAPPGDYTTVGAKGSVLFSSNRYGNVGGFKLLITSFYPAKNCRRGYFQCGNGRCIKDALKFNCRNNCGNKKDESCKSKSKCKKKDKKCKKQRSFCAEVRRRCSSHNDDDDEPERVPYIIAGCAVAFTVVVSMLCYLRHKKKTEEQRNKSKQSNQKGTSNATKPATQTNGKQQSAGKTNTPTEGNKGKHQTTGKAATPTGKAEAKQNVTSKTSSSLDQNSGKQQGAATANKPEEQFKEKEEVVSKPSTPQIKAKQHAGDKVHNQCNGKDNVNGKVCTETDQNAVKADNTTLVPSANTSGTTQTSERKSPVLAWQEHDQSATTNSAISLTESTATPLPAPPTMPIVIPLLVNLPPIPFPPAQSADASGIPLNPPPYYSESTPQPAVTVPSYTLLHQNTTPFYPTQNLQQVQASSWPFTPQGDTGMSLQEVDPQDLSFSIA